MRKFRLGIAVLATVLWVFTIATQRRRRSPPAPYLLCLPNMSFYRCLRRLQGILCVSSCLINFSSFSRHKKNLGSLPHLIPRTLNLQRDERGRDEKDEIEVCNRLLIEHESQVGSMEGSLATVFNTL